MIRIINTQSLYSGLYKAVEFCQKHKNENIEIVVPDKLSLFMERFLFEKLGLSSSFNIKVSTLNRFAKKNCTIPKDKQMDRSRARRASRSFPSLCLQILRTIPQWGKSRPIISATFPSLTAMAPLSVTRWKKG